MPFLDWLYLYGSWTWQCLPSHWRFLKSLGLEKSKLPLKDFIGEEHKGGLGTSAGQKRAPDPLDCSSRHQADVGARNQTQVFCRQKDSGLSLLPLNTLFLELRDSFTARKRELERGRNTTWLKESRQAWKSFRE